ncbi:MAG: hypothetical protein ACXWWA_14640, partial [Chitinophagaceae bacterium]
DLGPRLRTQRLSLLSWASSILADIPSGSIKERLHQLALTLRMNGVADLPDCTLTGEKMRIIASQRSGKHM